MLKPQAAHSWASRSAPPQGSDPKPTRFLSPESCARCQTHAKNLRSGDSACHPHYRRLHPASYTPSPFSSTACWPRDQVCPQPPTPTCCTAAPTESKHRLTPGYDSDLLAGLPAGLAGVHFICTARRSPVTRPSEHVTQGSRVCCVQVASCLPGGRREGEAGANPQGRKPCRRRSAPWCVSSHEPRKLQAQRRCLGTTSRTASLSRGSDERVPRRGEPVTDVLPNSAAGLVRASGEASAGLQAGEGCRMPLASCAVRGRPCGRPGSGLQHPGCFPPRTGLLLQAGVLPPADSVLLRTEGPGTQE